MLQDKTGRNKTLNCRRYQEDCGKGLQRKRRSQGERKKRRRKEIRRERKGGIAMKTKIENM